MSGTSFDCYSDWQCQSNQSKNVRFEMLQLQSATDPRSNPFPVPHCRSGLCSGHFQPDSTSRSTTRSSSTGRTLISSSATRSTNQSIPITIQTSFGTSLASQSSASCLSPIANLSSTTFEFEQAVRQVRSKSNPSSRSSIHNSRLNPSKPLRESHDRLENST